MQLGIRYVHDVMTDEGFKPLSDWTNSRNQTLIENYDKMKKAISDSIGQNYNERDTWRYETENLYKIRFGNRSKSLQFWTQRIFYKFLVDKIPTYTMNIIKEVQETYNVPPEKWTLIFSDTFDISFSNKTRSDFFRSTHRLFYSRSRLFNMSLIESPNCQRCNSNMQTSIHLFYECPQTRTLWNDICSKFARQFPNGIREYETLAGAIDDNSMMRIQKNILIFFTKT